MFNASESILLSLLQVLYRLECIMQQDGSGLLPFTWSTSGILNSEEKENLVIEDMFLLTSSLKCSCF